MQCPKDNGSMKQIELDGVRIDVCKSCLGVWLDAGELPQLVSKFSSNDFEGKLGEWEELRTTGQTEPKDFWREGKVPCPVDGNTMGKHYFAGNSGIGIDNCPKCNGFWFDGDEIKALLKYVGPNPTHDLLTNIVIKEQKQTEEEYKKISDIALVLQGLTSNPKHLFLLVMQIIARTINDRINSEID